MNKEGVIIFLSSEQDLYSGGDTSPSSFANPIPVVDLTESTEVALAEIILPEEYVSRSARSFELIKLQGPDRKHYLTFKLGSYRTTHELANHLNSQIHEIAKLRGDCDSVTHLIFSVSKHGCLIATPYKQNITNVLSEQQWLGFANVGKAKEFAALTGFQDTDIESLFTTSPRDEFEATTPPTVISTPLLAIETNILGDGTLRFIPAGQTHIQIKEKIYYPVKKGRYTGIKIRVVDPRTRSPINFKKGATVVVLHLKEGKFINV